MELKPAVFANSTQIKSPKPVNTEFEGAEELKNNEMDIFPLALSMLSI